MKKMMTTWLAAFALSASAQAADVEVMTGNYQPDWGSLSAWECPEWFKDAKFGIWAHWGPQCQAEDGDWYARFMYYEGSGQYNWHVNHFGNPKDFGLKELCNAWKADQWNPQELVSLYKSVGARYFMALGNHHDNFDNWNSAFQEWNSVNVGPKKDLIKGWSNDCKFDHFTLEYLGNTTGIRDVEYGTPKHDKVIYDLQGRQIMNRKLPKGLYIIDGKKVLIK